MAEANLLKTVNGEPISYDDIKAYFELNEQVKDLSKSLDKIKDKIKTGMITNDLDSLTAGEYVVSITNRTTTKVDDEMLSTVLVAHGLKDATEIKIVPVKEKVLLAIKEGKLQQAQYDLCTKNSYSQVMQVKKK